MSEILVHQGSGVLDSSMEWTVARPSMSGVTTLSSLQTASLHELLSETLLSNPRLIELDFLLIMMMMMLSEF